MQSYLALHGISLAAGRRQPQLSTLASTTASRADVEWASRVANKGGQVYRRPSCLGQCGGGACRTASVRLVSPQPLDSPTAFARDTAVSYCSRACAVGSAYLPLPPASLFTYQPSHASIGALRKTGRRQQPRGRLRQCGYLAAVALLNHQQAVDDRTGGVAPARRQGRFEGSHNSKIFSMAALPQHSKRLARLARLAHGYFL